MLVLLQFKFAGGAILTVGAVVFSETKTVLLFVQPLPAAVTTTV